MATTKPTVRCIRCGINTSNTSAICHRHPRNHVQPKRTLWGSSPTVPMTQAANDAAISRLLLSQRFPFFDGHVTTERVRTLSMHYARQAAVAWMAEVVQDRYADVLDPEQRNAALTLGALNGSKKIRNFNDHEVFDLSHIPIEGLNDIGKGEGDTRKRLTDYNSCVVVALSLSEAERTIGSLNEETSPEGIDYSSVSASEYQNFMNGLIAQEFDDHCERLMGRYGEFYQLQTGRRPKNAAPGPKPPVDEDLTAIDLYDPVSSLHGKFDQRTTDEQEEQYTADQLRILHEEEERVREERRSKRRAVALKVAGGAFDFVTDMAGGLLSFGEWTPSDDLTNQIMRKRKVDRETAIEIARKEHREKRERHEAEKQREKDREVQRDIRDNLNYIARGEKRPWWR